MSKASRLLQIITILSARRLAVRGEFLSERLGVSLRTIYRDIDALRAAGAEIDGEAGIGYVIAKTATLPPLSFTQDEVLALLVGGQMVQSFTDPELGAAAGSAREKILSVLNDSARKMADEMPYRAPILSRDDPLRQIHGELRRAILARDKLKINYRTKDGVLSERIIWPLGLGAWIGAWTLLAWCELRGDYRSFRVDLIEKYKNLKENYPIHEERNFEHYLQKTLNDVRDHGFDK